MQAVGNAGGNAGGKAGGKAGGSRAQSGVETMSQVKFNWQQISANIHGRNGKRAGTGTYSK